MSHTEIGTNRTGMATSPMDGASLTQAAKKTIPSRQGDATLLAEERIAAAEEVERIGSMPPPATVKGAAKSVFKALRGMNANVFVDKLGERLAFERTGTRLYDALLSKFDAYGTWKGGPSREALEEHRLEELAHFEMIREAIVQLGADPTVMTPSADLQAVASMGILQVITDPRTDLFECLDVMLIAELADNDAWEMLAQLARDLGQDRLAEDFHGALLDERRHLMHVREWVSARVGNLLAGRPSAPSTGSGVPPRGTSKKKKNGARMRARTPKKRGVSR